MTFNILYVTL